MGAHSLGSAVQWFSGYKGKWTGPNYIGFNEVFYAVMINSSITWTNTASVNNYLKLRKCYKVAYWYQT